MNKQKVKGLSGLIMSSNNPGEMVLFYKDVLGIPLELNQHGNLPEHWECDFEGIHFAVLKQNSKTGPSVNIVPSFAVGNIGAFVDEHGLKMLHPIIDLGGGSYVASISDPDGNTIRLWTNNHV